MNLLIRSEALCPDCRAAVEAEAAERAELRGKMMAAPKAHIRRPDRTTYRREDGREITTTEPLL